MTPYDMIQPQPRSRLSAVARVMSGEPEPDRIADLEQRLARLERIVAAYLEAEGVPDERG